MFDFRTITRNAIETARTNGTRYYASEQLAEQALALIPADVVTEFESKFGYPILRSLNNMAAQG